MKIDDPKTPYHEYSDEDEELNENQDEQQQTDPVVLEHLEEAMKNREVNAKTESKVKRQSKPGSGPVEQQPPMLGGFNPADLISKLEETKEDAENEE